MLGAATHKHFCATQIAQSSSQKYLGLVLEWDPWQIEQNYFPPCQGAHSGPKGSHDVNSITCTTEFMSLLPLPFLLTCKRTFLDEKQVQQVHQEPQGCGLRAAFSSAASDSFPTYTSVLSEIFPTFLHCPQSSCSILPSSQDHPKGTFWETSAPSSSSPDFPRMFVKSLCVIQTLHVTLPTQTGKRGYPPIPTDFYSHWKSLGCKQILNSGFTWEEGEHNP